MYTPIMLKKALAYELYNPNVPDWERNEERLHSRILADKTVETWPWSVPMPSTRRQVKQVAKLVAAKTYRPEDLAEIVAARI